MNIFYRGYVIHENIRSICYTIYGCRPVRQELDMFGTAKEAMEWVDQQVTAEPRKGPARLAPIALS